MLILVHVFFFFVWPRSVNEPYTALPQLIIVYLLEVTQRDRQTEIERNDKKKRRRKKTKQERIMYVNSFCIFQCCYFWASALQIQHGYPQEVRNILFPSSFLLSLFLSFSSPLRFLLLSSLFSASLLFLLYFSLPLPFLLSSSSSLLRFFQVDDHYLTRSYSLPRRIIFMIYRAIPFAYELR